MPDEIAVQQQTQGWKTYVFSGVAIVLGIFGAYFGILSVPDAAMLITIGCVAIGLRDAIAKLGAERIAEFMERQGVIRRKPQEKALPPAAK